MQKRVWEKKWMKICFSWFNRTCDISIVVVAIIIIIIIIIIISIQFIILLLSCKTGLGLSEIFWYISRNYNFFFISSVIIDVVFCSNIIVNHVMKLLAYFI